jgi:hypothetical protein
MAKILLTNHHLINYAGSELVTVDIATEFQQKGWNVTVATFQLGGDIAKTLKARGIKVVNILNNSLSESTFDLVWSHHYPVLIKCLMDDCVKTKCLILSSLSPYEPLEAIPFFLSQADMILCNSEETKQEIIKFNSINLDTKKILVFKNSVPTSWFNKTLLHNSSELSKLAIISNHPPQEVLDIISILKSKKIDTDLIGISGKARLVDIDLLISYDAIITIGRTVQHCMALGIPVFCYDHFGGPGWLTTDNFQQAEWFNYSGRCCYQKFTSDQLVDSLINGFNENKKYTKIFRNYAWENYLLTKNIETVLNYINMDNLKTRDYTNFDDELSIGKIGKAYRRILIERENLHKELERSHSQLQQTQTELERSHSQLQQTQTELERSHSQLQQTQTDLERSHSQLQQTQTELERSHSQLQQTQTELERSQVELKQLQENINEIFRSKFWKLRNFWFKFKHKFRIS